MNSVLSRVLAILLSLFTIFYFTYQVFLTVQDPYVTETALVDNYTDQIELDGIAIKSEELLQSNNSGVVNYTNTNAKKVLAGSTVASVYANQRDLEIGKALSEKQQKLEILQEVQEKHDSYQSNAASIMSSARDAQLELIEAKNSNDFSSVSSAEDDLLENILKQKIALDPTVSYSASIEQLTSEISVLKSQLTRTPEEITASSAGFFTNEVDGYEELITPDLVEDFSVWTPETLHEYQDMEPEDNSGALGKVVDSSGWYFVGEFDSDYVSRVDEGDTVTLSFSEGSGFQVKAEISQVITFDDSDTALVLLKSSNTTEGVVGLRSEHATMIFKTSKGIKVSKDAITLASDTQEDAEGEDETTTTPGVYVDMGQVVRFRKVDVLFEGDDYVVCDTHTDDSSYLQIYDEIILKGDDLYDGKPI